MNHPRIRLLRPLSVLHALMGLGINIFTHACFLGLENNIFPNACFFELGIGLPTRARRMKCDKKRQRSNEDEVRNWAVVARRFPMADW